LANASFFIAAITLSPHHRGIAEVTNEKARPQAAECQKLGKLDLLRVQDAPTQLVKADIVGTSADAPSYCKVEAYVTPQVGVEVLLPVTNWNGKLIAVGNGGWAGSFNEEACPVHLRRGYACVTTDTGHRGRGGLWAEGNLPAQIDFAYRAIHVSTLAAKAIARAYYSADPKKSYFMSCSTGGYQALVEAQRFPWDFDGIIAGAPDMDEADLSMRQIWAHRSLSDESGKAPLDPTAIKLLHEAALAQCDLDDGIKDGLISDPLECKVDPAKLRCKGRKTENCLSEAQVESARRIYAGPQPGAGRNIGGAWPGSENVWTQKYFGLDVPYEGADALFEYMLYGASPPWTSANYDFDQDYKRLGLGAIYTATNPDLRRFKAAGGKLIAYQGGTDVLEMPGAIVDYYQMAERLMGTRESTQDFFRLFVVPGMDHCGGGSGPYTIDYLGYLERWVESSQPPNKMIGAHVNDAYLISQPLPKSIESWLPPNAPELRAAVEASLLSFPLSAGVPIDFTRPIYPFPLHARYVGGDPTQASSFRPVGPESKPMGRTLH
jgi:feruloyl esterase